MTAIRKTISDAIPRVCVRMDDGSQASYQDAIDCIEAGVPVTLALNFANLRDDGQINPLLTPTTRMTKKQIHTLKALAAKKGVDFAIVQHSRSNWADFDDASTFEDIKAEVDPTELENEFGLPVKHYLQPGIAAAQSYVRNHRSQVIDALREVGIDYAFGITVQPTGAVTNLTNAAPLGMMNSTNRLWSPTDVSNGFQNSDGLKPGIVTDPYLFPDDATFDLGGFFVHRGVENGSSAPLPDPNSGAPGWMMGENNNGLGVEGDAEGDFEKIAQIRIARLLSAGLSFMIATHGTVRSDDVTVSSLSAGRGSSGTPAKLPGSWSWKHLANLLRRLEDAGHIKLVDMHDWAQYLYSDYELGTDLIGNPTMGVPLFDADERVDRLGDLVLPRGYSHKHIGINSFPAAGVCNLPTADSDLKYTSPLDIESVIGPNVVGPHDRQGGALMCANNDSNYASFNLGFDFIPPGRYKLSFTAADYTTGKLVFPDLHAIGARLRYRTEENTEAGIKGAQAEFTVLDVSSAFYNQIDPSMDASGSMPFELYFDLPENPQPMATGKVTDDPGTIGTGTSAVINGPAPSLTIANARKLGLVPGARVRIRTAATIPAGAWVQGVVTGLNSSDQAEVTITAYNESGSDWSPGNVEWVALVDTDLAYEAGVGAMPMGPWIYSIRLTIGKNTYTKVRLGGFELIKVG